MTPVVKEPRHGEKSGSRAFVPVKPLVLIGSQRPVVCGELNLGKTC